MSLSVLTSTIICTASATITLIFRRICTTALNSCVCSPAHWPVRWKPSSTKFTPAKLLVLPDQIHSYRTIGESQSVLWVFSTDWVPEFISQLGQREFITPVFRMEAAPLMELLWPGGNRCKQLAGLYLICGAALEQCFLQPRPVPDVDAHLSSKIIDYVQKNYTHTLTLEQMARDLGYNYTYLSAYFNHSLHTGFQGFINQYRISHAAALLQGSSLPITQVAEQCGFGTIRSFNRVFLKEKGMTPSAFRKQNVL